MAGNTRTLNIEITESRRGTGFKDAGQDAEDFARKADKSADKLDRLGEAGGTAETRFLGLGAGISGVSTIMSGDAGPEDYAMAMADLGDSIEHTVIPLIKGLGTQMLTAARTAVTTAAQHVAAAATTALAWVQMGIQATINAAKMAVAWLISLGPIGLVIAAVGAVIAILVALGVGFDDLARWAQAAWDWILGAAKAVWQWLADNWPLVLAILTGPIGLAVLEIQRNWDTIKSGASAVVDAVVGFFTSIPGRIVGVISSMAGKGAEMGAAFIDGVKGAITGAVGFAADIASAIVRALKSAWNSFADRINDLIPNSLGWGPASIDLPNNPIPHLAKGGIVPATPGGRLAVIGEGRYDEAVVPLRPGMGLGETVINLDMRGAIVADERQFEAMVVKAFRSAGAKGVPLTSRGRAFA